MDGSAKALAAAVIGVVAGFLLGGIGPRRELSAMQKDQEQLADQLLEARKRANRGPAIQYLPIPMPDRDPVARATPVPGATGEATPPGPEDDDGFGLGQAEFDLAADAQRLRMKQSKQALRERADLAAAKEAELDAILKKMNEELAKHAEEIAKLVEMGADAQPVDFLQLSHDVTGILLDSQKAWEQSLGNDFDGLDETNQQVWNYVDLEYFRSAFEQLEANGSIP